jgi:transposase-like protein
MQDNESKSYQVSHCGLKNGQTLELKPNEKKGFVCEGCNKLFDVDYTGEITESPLNKIDSYVKMEGRRNVTCTSGGWRHDLGKENDCYK